MLLQAIRPTAAFSLIDYGCGALADDLAVRSRPCPLISCRNAGRNDALAEGNYCAASGVFNVRLGTEPEVWFEYTTHVWDEMNRVSPLAFAFNCLSAASDVARWTHLLNHADPARVFDHCRRRDLPSVALLHGR